MFLDHRYFKQGYFNLTVALMLGVFMLEHLFFTGKYGFALMDLVLAVPNYYFYRDMQRRNG